MVRMIMHGLGRMGRMIMELCQEDNDIEIVAGVDKFVKEMPFPVFAKIEDCNVEADVIVDFSDASSADALLDYCGSKGIPVVLCTTGLSEGQLAKMRETSKKVAILKSANMSIGINLIQKVLGEIAPVLSREGFDIEIIEKHHNKKLDAPSGTALALADSINEAFGEEDKFHYVYDRSQVHQKRDGKEIGISAIRGGTIVGEHDVIFAGSDEIITISHQAGSRAVFGKGAIAAARFLAGKAPGLYDMGDVL